MHIIPLLPSVMEEGEDGGQ